MKTTAAKPTPQQAAYDAWHDEQVRLGLEDIEAGNVISHEDAIRQMDAFMKKLEKKHRVKAA
ncbi:MAG: hypothetical protein HZB71_14460 [Betaproteobacteria bacterium]|nr:hypothetical protein [Betaproteobacteria bacterium]